MMEIEKELGIVVYWGAYTDAQLETVIPTL